MVHRRGAAKGEEGAVLGESGSTIIYMILLSKVQRAERRKDNMWCHCKTHDINKCQTQGLGAIWEDVIRRE